MTERPGYLRLYGNDAKAEDTRTQALLVRRQQHNYFEAAVAMEFEPEQEGEEAGMIVTQNDRYAIMAVKEKLDGELFITAYQIINGRRELITRKPAEAGRMYLFIEGSTGQYHLYYGNSEREKKILATDIDGSILSTVVADGFVGTYVGMYVSGRGAHADFDWFRYEIVEE